jgi:hypothetical protein
LIKRAKLGIQTKFALDKFICTFADLPPKMVTLAKEFQLEIARDAINIKIIYNKI